MMYHNTQVNERRSRALAIERSVRQGYPLSPLLYVLALEPLLRELRDEGENPALRGVPLADLHTARVSVFADDITVFVSRCLDINSGKKAVGGYERIAGAKVLTKAKVCCSVLGGVAVLFHGPSVGVTGLSTSLGCVSGLTSNWSEIDRKYKLRWVFRWEPGFQGGCP